MSKKFFNISLTNEKKFKVYENGICNISLDSLESLKSFLSGNFKFDDIEKKIRNYYLYFSEYTDEEIELYVDKEINIIKHYYHQIIKENYTCNYLDICDNNNMSTEDIQNAIILLKDGIHFINMNNLDINVIYKILKNIKIDETVRINTKYNYFDSCTKTEILKLMDFLNNIKNLVNRYNLSPFEICIFVNDLIKERQYKINKLENNLSIDRELRESIEINSRSLMKILQGDEIVCVGFSNLFSSILDYIGIKSIVVLYFATEENKPGHASNIVYINDDKYNINGLYEIDTTWGRVYESDGSYNYEKSLQNYRHFARSLDEAFMIKKISHLSPDIKDFRQLQRRIERLNINAPDIIFNNNIRLIIDSCLKIQDLFHCNFFNTEINILYDFINENENWREQNSGLLKSTLSNINDKIFVQNILLSFQKALYRVKLVEHSIDKNKFPLTKEILNTSYHSRVEKEHLIYDTLFGNQVEISDKEELEIARSELISVLHKLAKDNVDKNPLQHK